MSFFDISNLANKFAGFDIPPDTEFQQRSDDYGYTQTSDHEGGYTGEPPSGYPCGPQEGESEYRSTHPDYSTSDTTRNGLGEGGTYSYNPSSQELYQKAQDAQAQTPSADSDLPEGWSKKFDDRYNRWYYVNKETSETQWHPPGRDNSDDASTDGGGILTPATTTDDPSQPWYHHGTHGDSGEAGGYYSGNKYQANTPYETGAFSDSRGFPQDGNSGDGQRSYGGGEAPSAQGRSSSGYGKAMLGVAGGLAVGAAGGALLAHALASDSDDDDEEEVVASAYAERSTTDNDSYYEQDPEPEEEDEESASSASDPEPEPESEPEPEFELEAEEEMEPATQGFEQEEHSADESSSASDVEEESEPEPEPEPEPEEEEQSSDSSSASEAEEEEEPEEEPEPEPEDAYYSDGGHHDGGADYSGDEGGADYGGEDDYY